MFKHPYVLNSEVKMADINQFFSEFIDQEVGVIPYTDKVVCCNSTDKLGSAVKKMVEHNIGCIVVVEGNQPVGIFTERDLLLRVQLGSTDVVNRTVTDFMTPFPVCISPDTPLKQVMAAMRIGKFRHLIVTGPHAEMIGIISIKDVLDYLIDSANAKEI